MLLFFSLVGANLFLTSYETQLEWVGFADLDLDQSWLSVVFYPDQPISEIYTFKSERSLFLGANASNASVAGFTQVAYNTWKLGHVKRWVDLVVKCGSWFQAVRVTHKGVIFPLPVPFVHQTVFTIGATPTVIGSLVAYVPFADIAETGLVSPGFIGFSPPNCVNINTTLSGDIVASANNFTGECHVFLNGELCELAVEVTESANRAFDAVLQFKLQPLLALTRKKTHWVTTRLFITLEAISCCNWDRMLQFAHPELPPVKRKRLVDTLYETYQCLLPQNVFVSEAVYNSWVAVIL